MMKQQLIRQLQKSFLTRAVIRLGLTDRILARYWREKNSGWWERVAATGEIEKPDSIWLEATMRCNLKCVMCHQRQRVKSAGEELTLDEIRTVADQAAAQKIGLIEMTGGELFVRKDMLECITAIDSRGIALKFNTNGTLLGEREIAGLKPLRNLQSIAFSIDGPAEVHNAIRGNPHAFEKAIAAIRAFGPTRFLKNVTFVVMPDNIKYIPFMFELCAGLGADRLSFLPEMYSTPQEIAATRAALGLQGEKIYVEEKERVADPDYTDRMAGAFRDIARLRRKHGLFAFVYPPIAYFNAPEFLGRRFSGRLVCKYFRSLTIAVNGDVYLCPFIHCKAGNIRQQPFAEIWNNDILRGLRRKILGNRTMVPVCHSCCSLSQVS